MIQSFLKYLEFERRYSGHTLQSYKTDILQFEKFLEATLPEFNLLTTDYRAIRAWILDLMDQGMDPRSVNRKIASLRSFYKFLLKRSSIKLDPTRQIKVLKTKKQLPSFIKETEITHLLDHFHFPDDFPGYRDQLMLELLYGTGIRLSELISLEETSVNFFNNTIKVLGKRNKERVLPISKNLTQTIENYVNKKNIEFDYNSIKYLLVTDNGKQCYPMMIYRTVKKYLDAFTTLDKRSPHVLRHTFATHLLNKGADLNAVKDLLGHTSLAATQVYTHNSLDKLKSVFDQAHPKA
ncbi:tyrosine-type recombinase/integrase [Fulvivirgaceae bacterium BMA10]|uniref:Tyrosine recombinase XerC n=1 Tax=Splendidivirga corallicola TaxID=3051826 RepID=A0ABT8KLE9_9BACT|nr:tyrosine-type recombinase/integrase [Fulvivirgaceae bacterium BMA10]